MPKGNVGRVEAPTRKSTVVVTNANGSGSAREVENAIAKYRQNIASTAANLAQLYLNEIPRNFSSQDIYELQRILANSFKFILLLDQQVGLGYSGTAIGGIFKELYDFMASTQQVPVQQTPVQPQVVVQPQAPAQRTLMETQEPEVEVVPQSRRTSELSEYEFLLAMINNTNWNSIGVFEEAAARINKADLSPNEKDALNAILNKKYSEITATPA